MRITLPTAEASRNGCVRSGSGRADISRRSFWRRFWICAGSATDGRSRTPTPGGHRTSNMLDRLMRGMNRYFDHGQHLHGSYEACRLHSRG